MFLYQFLDGAQECQHVQAHPDDVPVVQDLQFGTHVIHALAMDQGEKLPAVLSIPLTMENI